LREVLEGLIHLIFADHTPKLKSMG
jgi:hypothetical protein